MASHSTNRVIVVFRKSHTGIFPVLTAKDRDCHGDTKATWRDTALMSMDLTANNDRRDACVLVPFCP